MKQPVPVVTLHGCCAEAVQFYLRIFPNTRAKITTFADAREEFGAMLTQENESLVFKADLIFSDGQSEIHMIFGDSPTLLFQGQRDGRRGNADNLIFEYECPDADMLRELYEKFLADGAKTNGTLKCKSGCTLYGSIIDQYGLCWNLYLRAADND